MNTTHIVQTLTDLSVFSQPTQGGNEWILKIIETDPGTQKTTEHFVSLSTQLVDLSINYDQLNNRYNVTVASRTTPPGTYGSRSVMTSNAIRYEFAEDSQKRASIIVIEDITIYMQMTRGTFLLDQHILTMRVSPSVIGGGSKFDHEFWYN